MWDITTTQDQHTITVNMIIDSLMEIINKNENTRTSSEGGTITKDRGGYIVVKIFGYILQETKRINLAPTSLHLPHPSSLWHYPRRALGKPMWPPMKFVARLPCSPML
jgi:hypothetical protein